MKVFYSWQTDAPRKINKDFIHTALMHAVRRLSEQLDVSEAERGDIEVDQDTQGVLGSPDIARVILEKIASSNVVVADVSLVAAGSGDKRHINSNVAIELGYTYGKLGDQAVLKIMNTHYGLPTELPFDLRTRRHPVQYCLEPDAANEEIESEKKQLAAQITNILKRYLEQPAFSLPEAGHVETPSSGKRGMFWGSSEVIVPKRRPYVSCDTYSNVPSVIYFRCIPKLELPVLTSLEASNAASDLRPLPFTGGFSQSRNKWGVVSHFIGQDGDIIGFTQIFKNREIWGVDTYCSNILKDPEDAEEEPKRVIPTGALQRDYPSAIDSMLQTAVKLGYGENFTVEMGVSGASGIHLAIDRRYFEPYPGPVFDDEVFVRQTISSDYQVGAIMNAFWGKLFSEAGREVPPELLWRPQG